MFHCNVSMLAPCVCASSLSYGCLQYRILHWCFYTGAIMLGWQELNVSTYVQILGTDVRNLDCDPLHAYLGVSPNELSETCF